jgi:hypothetical protein
MADTVFRVTRIDLGETEKVSAVHAVADEQTLDVIRELADGAPLGTSPENHVPGADWLITMPVLTFLAVLHASGKIPGNDPRYRPGLNDGLFRVWAGLMEGDGY